MVSIFHYIKRLRFTSVIQTWRSTRRARRPVGWRFFILSISLSFFFINVPFAASQNHPVPSTPAELTRGDYQSAIDLLNKRLAANPSDEDAERNLLRAFLGTGRYAQAESSAKGFLAKHANASRVRHQLGEVYAATGRYSEAAGEFERVGRELSKQIGATPARLESDVRRAEMLLTTGREDEARQILQSIVEYHDANAPQIPAAAVTTEDADRLQRMSDRGTTVRVRLKMDAQMLPDSDSFNVVGEIRGREFPDEVIVLGGHFDSWDVGTGSTDDGGGTIVTWEALRLMKKLNLRPRRTVRVVLWTNEENGLRGGTAYRDRYRDQLANHVLMMESDSGVFRPTGFGFTGSDAARAKIEGIATLLRGIQAGKISPAGGGADIGPSVEAGKIPSMSLEVDGNYFLLHHTPADTVDKIDPMDMARASGAIAVMSYVIADLPERIR